MRIMYDNTGLPANPPDVDATAFYIGGEDPYRVWPRAEIDGIKTRYRLPIWVNSHPTNATRGEQDGIAAAGICERLGQPKDTCIALDLETANDSAYVQAFDKGVKSKGYLCIGYGSESTVFNNGPLSGGYWVALWDGHPDLPKGKGWSAKQYANDTMLGKAWDLSVVADFVKLWDTQGGNVNADDVWSHEIAVPDYAQEDHPGVKSIPAAGYLRGTEHLGHQIRGDVAALSAQVSALTDLVNQLVTASKTDTA